MPRLLIPGLILLAACGDREPRPGEIRGTILPEGLPRPDFTLTATDGTAWNFRERTDGVVTLLFFGYTYCPDICPVHMANIAQVLRKIHPSVASQVTVVMVSTDPARDTPERLRGWLDNFSTSFVGLRGDLETVNRIQAELRMPPAVTGTGENYTVGHSSLVVAFTVDDRAHVVYPFGIRQVDWANDIPLLVNRDWSSMP